MLLRIDPSRDTPLWEQIAGSVRAEIAGGRLRAGDRLPSAREVAASLDLNLHTVLRAYQQLRDERLVDLRRGRGALVTDAASGLRDLQREVRSLAESARRRGIAPSALASLLTDADPRSSADNSTDSSEEEIR
ncbi:MAG: GntR family transcriptional regulator [Microbacterium sp. 67-17]|uniref:GntR family transcriptional regulator n=1 Tax=Microbacterium sp. 67-17 TaxID=1895782 RepID=UPI00095B7F93|nr:GntR family transcriptional regulator [Microbacterium sp. 67-17]OJV98865.1 MAG: GntR family transcriptional regulator [Microbacterium sp. 67-17]